MTITKKELLEHRSVGPLSKVRAAREVLRERAVELIEAYISLAAEARAAGQFDVSSEILWKLIDHIPKDELQGIIDSPSSKPPELTQSTQPLIQIGIALDSNHKPKALSAVNIIDLETDE